MTLRLPHALAALVSLVLVASPSPAATLKIATVVPDGTSWMKEMRAGAKQIAERTQGRVKLKFYPGGVMGTEKSVMRKIRAGQLQGGAFTSTGLADVYRETEIYGLPLLFHSYDEVDYVRARMDQSIREGLERAGLIALAISETGFAYLLSNKPLRSVDDLSGARVWVLEGDRLSQTALKIAGVSPVPLALADVYTGLQTGLIDTVAASPVACIAFQWHTKVRYMTDVPLMYLAGVLAIDARAFGKLDEADQAVVRDVIGAAAGRLDEMNRVSDASAKLALKTQGIEFVTSSAEELERWRGIAEAALSRVRAEGLYSDRMIETLLGHLATYRARSQTASE
ncbi:MAG: TRAP transporter substrate-binding protein DctP [Myxococcota bacterium]